MMLRNAMFKQTLVRSRRDLPAINEAHEAMEDAIFAAVTTPEDLTIFNKYIHVLSMDAKHPGCAEKAHDLLVSLEHRYAAGEVSFRPNLETYNFVIDAWSMSSQPDAAMKAVALLRVLIDGDGPEDPDSFSFNQALSALSKSPKLGAACLAEELLQYQWHTLPSPHPFRCRKSPK